MNSSRQNSFRVQFDQPAARGRARAARRAAFVVAAGLAAAAAAQGQDGDWVFTYPIWLSPALELASLSDIDARLSRPLESDERIEVTRNGAASSRQAARNCNLLATLSAQGYRPDAGVDNYLYVIQKTTCEAITLLRRSRPARESLVRTFVLSEVALRYLPARIDPGIACGADGRLPGGDLTLTSWRDYFGGEGGGAASRGRLTVAVRNQSEMTVTIPGADVTFEILARGDLNDDGMEDLILRVSRDLSRASPGTANVFLLTRDAPDGLLRVIDDRCGDRGVNATSIRPR